jgi:hypothetical protein
MSINLTAASYKTRLPIAFAETSETIVPQHDAVAWAFWASRKHLRGEPLTAQLVLVAYAQHALAALSSQQGYMYTMPEDISNLIGISTSTVRRYTKMLAAKGLLNNTSYLSGARVSEDAFNAAWVV